MHKRITWEFFKVVLLFTAMAAVFQSHFDRSLLGANLPSRGQTEQAIIDPIANLTSLEKQRFREILSLVLQEEGMLRIEISPSDWFRRLSKKITRHSRGVLFGVACI